MSATNSAPFKLPRESMATELKPWPVKVSAAPVDSSSRPPVPSMMSLSVNISSCRRPTCSPGDSPPSESITHRLWVGNASTVPGALALRRR
jgi:hypothetical protein